MMKYLVLLAVVAVVYALWRGQRQEPRKPAACPGPRLPEPMVRCERCGVHLPRSQAVLDGLHSYCCTAHQRGD